MFPETSAIDPRSFTLENLIQALNAEREQTEREYRAGSRGVANALRRHSSELKLTHPELMGYKITEYQILNPVTVNSLVLLLGFVIPYALYFSLVGVKFAEVRAEYNDELNILKNTYPSCNITHYCYMPDPNYVCCNRAPGYNGTLPEWCTDFIQDYNDCTDLHNEKSLYGILLAVGIFVPLAATIAYAVIGALLLCLAESLSECYKSTATTLIDRTLGVNESKPAHANQIWTKLQELKGALSKHLLSAQTNPEGTALFQKNAEEITLKDYLRGISVILVWLRDYELKYNPETPEQGITAEMIGMLLEKLPRVEAEIPQNTFSMQIQESAPATARTLLLSSNREALPVRTHGNVNERRCVLM